jgi:hypothetical protein
MSPILDDLKPAAEFKPPREFTLFLNFVPTSAAPDTDGKRFGEVWLYPGRAGHGPCEWGYRIGDDWCTSCDMRIMDPQPTHFAYPNNTHTP